MVRLSQLGDVESSTDTPSSAISPVFVTNISNVAVSPLTICWESGDFVISILGLMASTKALSLSNTVSDAGSISNIGLISKGSADTIAMLVMSSVTTGESQL